jgi:hypothetical protein
MPARLLLIVDVEILLMSSDWGWELDLEIHGESKHPKQAEAVFRKSPEIKQRTLP